MTSSYSDVTLLSNHFFQSSERILYLLNSNVIRPCFWNSVRTSITIIMSKMNCCVHYPSTTDDTNLRKLSFDAHKRLLNGLECRKSAGCNNEHCEQMESVATLQSGIDYLYNSDCYRKFNVAISNAKSKMEVGERDKSTIKLRSVEIAHSANKYRFPNHRCVARKKSLEWKVNISGM